MPEENLDNQDNQENEKSTVDKVVMGAIIGTAIGSAVGLTMAPKKGEETRKVIKNKASGVGSLTKETTTGLFKLAKNLIFGKKKKQKKMPAPSMKKIPQESEIIPPEYVDRD